MNDSRRDTNDRVEPHQVVDRESRCTCGCGPGVGAGHHEPRCGEPDDRRLPAQMVARYRDEAQRGLRNMSGDPRKDTGYDRITYLCDEVEAIRSDAQAAARINAETIVGMQEHARKMESVLRTLLAAIEEADSDAERYILGSYDNCPECTAGTALTYVHPGTGMRRRADCPRHAAERLLKEVGK